MILISDQSSSIQSIAVPLPTQKPGVSFEGEATCNTKLVERPVVESTPYLKEVLYNGQRYNSDSGL